MRNLMSYGIALAIILVVALWMSTGTFVQGGRGPGNGEESIVSLVEPNGGPLTDFKDATGLKSADEEQSAEEVNPELTIAERNEQDAGNGEGALRSVRVQTFVAQPFPIEVDLRGKTEAKASVTATPETSGIVDTVEVKKGDSVKEGDVLCTIDRGTREAGVAQARAALAQAQAALQQAQTNLDNNKVLREKGVAPANTAMQFEVALEASKAGVTAAQAGLDNALAEFNRTEVRARLDGVVTGPMTEVGALLSPGAPCATIVQLDPIVFVGSVPEARIGLAKLGLPVEITTVAGDTLSGEVTYISPVADDATRSFRVEATADNPGSSVRDGLTASAKVKVGTLPAHLVPQSVLTLGDEGELGIRAVKDGVVQFYKITIVSDSRDGVWVTGLPISVDVITLGQENVKAGQQVNAQAYEDEGTPA
ncbi:MAG: efflux RND transporter periplasmic adaptor subunit [Hyphomicrobiaceae bacterium]|nr:efflux RND transporter periplasmic adaptor subunit [Hyphomicrobiaceae bacterium]MCC0024583.1 efflux RND transporter periplasmic adaptor subunit [Hyphomicrobiaceae bacterium]